MKLNLVFEKSVKTGELGLGENTDYFCLLKFLSFGALIMKKWNRAPSPHFVSGVGGSFETACVCVCYLAIKRCKNKQWTCWNAGLSLCPVLWDFSVPNSPSHLSLCISAAQGVGGNVKWAVTSEGDGCILPTMSVPVLLLKNNFKA